MTRAQKPTSLDRFCSEARLSRVAVTTLNLHDSWEDISLAHNSGHNTTRHSDALRAVSPLESPSQQALTHALDSSWVSSSRRESNLSILSAVPCRDCPQNSSPESKPILEPWTDQVTIPEIGCSGSPRFTKIVHLLCRRMDPTKQMHFQQHAGTKHATEQRAVQTCAWRFQWSRSWDFTERFYWCDECCQCE